MPNKGNFPARNRIIAGLSHGCLVVQAAKKSGAKITAEFALNQGKQVFAIPGPINSELQTGCHELIKQGAKLVEDVDDIMEEFPLIEKMSIQSTRGKTAAVNTAAQKDQD